MYAKKMILQTDIKGKFKYIPVLPANKKVEAIFLIEDDASENDIQLRKPHTEIAGKLTIKDDIINTIPVESWLNTHIIE